MTLDARDKEQIWQRLQQSAFRRRFSLNPHDNGYLHAKGMTVILNHARDFIASRLAPALPAKDWETNAVAGPSGLCRPICDRDLLPRLSGEVVRHTAWRGVALSEAEQAFIVAMIVLWLERRGSGGQA